MPILAFALASFLSQPVVADEIGGDWCATGGAHLRIEGAEVVTPGGQRTHCIYSRHAYEFMIPDGESDAGLTARMRQLSEERAQVTIEGRKPEEWTRCHVTS